MSEDLETLVGEGYRQLGAADWAAAARSFRAALQAQPSGEALYGLGSALWWLGDMDGTISYFEQAHAAFREHSDLASAAAVALRIGFHQRTHLANPAAAAGWLARGTRLIDEHALEGLRGELALMRACIVDDPAEAEACAQQALEIARGAADPDLELCSLSQLGRMRIGQGRVSEGIALLDEACAGSLGGEARELDTVVFTSCNTIVACASCAELERATQWVREAERFAERYGCPFLWADCRVVYGEILVATGAWDRAEGELEQAIALSKDAVPAYHAQALAALATLRLAQGRLEEAEQLVAADGADDLTAAVRTRIQLLRDEPSLAATTARRALESMGEDRLESAVLIELLGEAEIALGEPRRAAERGRALAERGGAHGCRLMSGRGERLVGRALSASDDPAACRALDRARAIFVEIGMPYEVACTRLLLARALRADEPAAAQAEARAALSSFEQLGAGRDADVAASLLRELGVKAARAGPKGTGALTKREREVLALVGEGLSNPDIAARLHISRKTVEHHVAHVLGKLGARSRAEAAAAAARMGRSDRK